MAGNVNAAKRACEPRRSIEACCRAMWPTLCLTLPPPHPPPQAAAPPHPLPAAEQRGVVQQPVDAHHPGVRWLGLISDNRSC